MLVTEWLKQGFRDNSVYQAADFADVRQGKGANNPKNAFQFIKDTSLIINSKLKERTFVKDHLFSFGEEFDMAHDLYWMKVLGSSFADASVETGNLVGAVEKDGYTLNIHSRFGESFLRYLISATEGFLGVEDLGSYGKQGFVYWMLVYLWKMKLKQAYMVGIPKMYKQQMGSLSKVRGNLAINEYIKQSADNGRYPCSYREYSYDNALNQLIGLTFTKLSKDPMALEIIRDIIQLKNIFLQNSRPFSLDMRSIDQIKITNPFYQRYNEVIQLSRMILKNQSLDLAPEDHSFRAFFFDISLLFEHHIRKLFILHGLQLEPKNLKTDIQLPTGTRNRSLYPDIMIHHREETYLFDVKYKQFDPIHGVSREDLFQLITYVSMFSRDYDIKACGFVYPIREGVRDHPYIKTKLNGFKEIDFYIFFYEIPEEQEGFMDRMQGYSKQFVQNLARELTG